VIEIQAPEIILRDGRVARMAERAVGRDAGAVVMERLIKGTTRTGHHTKIL
jgi:hypothetical protein